MDIRQAGKKWRWSDISTCTSSRETFPIQMVVLARATPLAVAAPRGRAPARTAASATPSAPAPFSRRTGGWGRCPHETSREHRRVFIGAADDDGASVSAPHRSERPVERFMVRVGRRHVAGSLILGRILHPAARESLVPRSSLDEAPPPHITWESIYLFSGATMPCPPPLARLLSRGSVP